MFEYGIKIKNYDAKSIHFNNTVKQTKYKFTYGLLANSLFCDFIVKNGLRIDKKNGSTKDIICIDFEPRSSPLRNEVDNCKFAIKCKEDELIEKLSEYDEEIADLRERWAEGELTDEELKNCIADVQEKKEVAKEAKDEEVSELEAQIKTLNEFNKEHDSAKKSFSELREEFYEDGVDIFEEGKTRPIHYVMLYRSTGKAKKGSCIFIVEKLYKVAIEFLRMGMKFPKKNFPIVELGAYASLVASTIVGRIKIDPKNILIIDDVTVSCIKDVVVVKNNENDELFAEPCDNYDVESTLFDGQALIDKEVFEQAIFDNPEDKKKKGNGYLLLRNHFCKMAAFNTNIQEFFKDYCKDHCENYDTFEVTDRWGTKHLAKDIQLITTENSMKWTKFCKGEKTNKNKKVAIDEKVNFDYWCKKVNENGNIFGIVKTAHESKYGDVQRMSYQMVNALEPESAFMDKVTQWTLKYIDDLKKNHEGKLFKYMENHKNGFSNDYEFLLEICNKIPDFESSEHFKSVKDDIIGKISKEARLGKLFQNGDNLVIVGSPYAMLLAAAGVDVKNKTDCDVTFELEEDAIQCYSERFENGAFLAEFRSPFNGRNNMGYLHNVRHPLMEKYFSFGKQIIAVNLMKTDFTARNNGSDQDSDTIFTTDQPQIVECARRNYLRYPTIVNAIGTSEKLYENTPQNFASVDSALAGAMRAIGEASNLAQLCLTYSHHYAQDGDQWNEYLCILSVLAQLAIDNAKKQYDIDFPKVIAKIRKEMNIPKYGYPNFWKLVNKDFDFSSDKKIIVEMTCPMNSIKLGPKRYHTPTKSLKEFFSEESLKKLTNSQLRKIEEPIEAYMRKVNRLVRNMDSVADDTEPYLVLESEYQALLDELRKTRLNIDKNLVARLIDRALFITPKQKEQRKNSKRLSKTYKNKPLLLKILYDLNAEVVLDCFKNPKKNS